MDVLGRKEYIGEPRHVTLLWWLHTTSLSIREAADRSKFGGLYTMELTRHQDMQSAGICSVG